MNLETEGESLPLETKPMSEPMSHWEPGDPLPKPTRSQEQAIADLKEFGYTIIEDALDADQTAGIRDRLTAQAEAEIEAGIAFEDQGVNQNRTKQYDRLPQDAFTATNGGVNQRVWMLVNKGQVFQDLVTDQFMTPLIEYLLGPNFLLSTLSANIAKPGGVEMGLHTDQWWMPRPMPRSDHHVAPGTIERGEFYGIADGDPRTHINPPCACNVMYCLNDFTDLNGATRLVPKSHLTGLQPPPDVPHTVASISAEASAGSAIVFEGRLWHGTGANRSNGPRLGILATYCGPQFRTQENYTLGIAPEVRDRASPELLARLGFKIWNAYGRTGDPNKGYVNTSDQIIGEMRPRNTESEIGTYRNASE